MLAISFPGSSFPGGLGSLLCFLLFVLPLISLEGLVILFSFLGRFFKGFAFALAFFFLTFFFLGGGFLGITLVKFSPTRFLSFLLCLALCFPIM